MPALLLKLCDVFCGRRLAISNEKNHIFFKGIAVLPKSLFEIVQSVF